MYGMKRIDDDVFIFVTYHKEESTDEQKNYVDGKRITRMHLRTI